MTTTRIKSNRVDKFGLWVALSVCALVCLFGQTKDCTADDTVKLNLPGNVKLELVRIPAGRFRMGSPDSERGRYGDEGPVHAVNIKYDFYMGKYEVTQAQWKAVMGTNPARRLGVGDDYPVSHVSWDQCRQFIGKLKQLGLPGTFRLPSETEWEYACRAGTKTRFYFGDSLDAGDSCENCTAGTLPGKRSDYMRYCGSEDDPENPDFGTIEVGQLKPNAFGLYDMHGNVWEWCLDQYQPDYVGAPTDGRARQRWAGAPRVLRGGGWGYHTRKCRSAVRCGYSANRGYTFHGMRIVWFPYEKHSDEWFRSWMAETIGDNMVSYQSETGAWPKNMRMEAHGYQGEKFTKNWDSSIDNGTTHTQMNFLAKLYYATGKKRFRDSFVKGLDWLLEAQYDNGGWPQRYPLCGDYGDFITFNDNAMVGVMQLLRSVIERPESDLVDAQRRKKVKQAYDKGLDCILNCQVVIDGRRTAWSQQHDPSTLEPRRGRSYEPPSISGGESAGIVFFLMSIKEPSEQVIRAVHDAVAWYENSKITGIRYERTADGAQMVKDPGAPTLWARFYEPATGRPIFSGRDGVIRYSIEEVEKERLHGYRWFVRDGEKVLAEYPRWKSRIKR
ncbi:MAG: pectate lyase [Planctomycetota bacterium]|jgi:PelA/Pel-15E family pectate lyase